MPRRSITDMSAWPSLFLEGNLIAPAMIQKIDRQQASDQSEQDYGIRRGLTARDEISTAFRVGQSHYDTFKQKEHPSAEATRRYVKEFLEQTFGFHDLRQGEGIVSIIAGGRVPIVIVPPEEVLDRRSPTLSTDKSRSPMFALQDYLNEEDEALWGLVTNGLQIRLMRDNASLTRPAYIDADLAQIFENDDAASFAALWLIIHRTRFGIEGSPATDCPLERWRDAGTLEGVAARDRLAGQVEIALRVLGSGFLVANPDLATKIRNGEVPLTEWFNELLHLIYRLIFLMVAEDRGLLHPDDANPDARKLYADGYSLTRLRSQSIRRSTWDRYHDKFEGLKIVFRSLARSEPGLALPALGGLFDRGHMANLESAKLSNRALMEVIYRLAWLKNQNALAPINWRAMETEELGSVYESLLELQPQLSEDGRALRFASDAAEQLGNQRRTTGSYYTPDSLVQALLDTALDPVLDRTEAEAVDPAAALLALKVIDPACGSGHFLLAAARRIATRVARIRAEGTPSLVDFRHALRDAARSCIYGVDRNPMAVELTKVALWIETIDPGFPLGFFDAQIRCGDALLGIYDLKTLEFGIPESAYKPLTGDDRETAIYYKNRNRDEIRGQGAFDYESGGSDIPSPKPLVSMGEELRNLPENSIADIEAKSTAFRNFRDGPKWFAWKIACDSYLAAFLAPKVGGQPNNRNTVTIPTTAHVWAAATGHQVYGPLVAEVDRLVNENRAFHWPLEFPDILQHGGFDVVLGNPPWEVIQFSDAEYFAGPAPEIAVLTGAQRKEAIAELKFTNRPLWDEYRVRLRDVEATKEFMKSSKRFPLTAHGKLNLYALFAELADRAANDCGRSGIIVQSGISTDDGNKKFFDHLMSNDRLVCLFDFENKEKLFPIHRSMKFAILVLGNYAQPSDFVFFATNPNQIDDPERRFQLSAEDIDLINPNTKTCPVFRSRTDAALTKTIYENSGAFIDKSGEPSDRWAVELSRILNLTDDSHLFKTEEDLAEIGGKLEGNEWHGKDGLTFLPLYEPKMIHHFDHRWASFDARRQTFTDVSEDDHKSPNFNAQPRWWVESTIINEWLSNRNWASGWLFGWRDTTNATNERTTIATIFPVCAVGNNLPQIILGQNHQPRDYAVLVANLSSITFDYASRQKVGGTHLNYFLMEQLPVLPPKTYSEARYDFIVSHVLELLYTSNSMAPFAHDLDFDGPPFSWNEERRAMLRADLDAFFARAYRLNRDELRYILDPISVKGPEFPSETFRVLKDKEERELGEYRTQRLVLEAWDRMEADGTFQSMDL